VEDNQLSHRGADAEVSQSGLVNLPNYITLTRIFSIPVLIWILSSSRFNSTNGERELLASAVFIAASITDAIDGYLARKRAQVTTMGMLLDPVADKLLIAAAFVTLVQFNPRTVPAWMAIIVIGREFLVSGLRSIAASEGFTIQASDLGKMKMVVQIVSVVAAIIDHHWTRLPWYFLSLPVHPIALISIWVMVGLSMWSAVDYFVAFWSRIDQTSEKRRRRRSFVLSRRRKRNDVPVV
jgi:CDP-diacylglycerol--glycerol-3-phosphate 3-phosphatidyltransferase